MTNRCTSAIACAAILLSVLITRDGRAQEHSPHSLGTIDFRISCSDRAQQSFNHAMALLHHMTYPQAREAFERIAAAEPDCAMAHWGIAMTLFQPLWPTRPSAAALDRGWSEAQKARMLTHDTRELLFIDAARAFFMEPASTDYWLRIRRWEEAARQAYSSLPKDTEAALFYALAHLATAPSNSLSRTHADESAAILIEVYEHHPDHPGAMHYLVHANDVPGREHELLEVTRKYEEIAPNNPHALHMPTHIYARLGQWDAVISGNLRAADAALAHPAGEHGELVWDEFAHAIEYLVYAYLQQGDDERAALQLRRLQRTERLEPTFKTAFHLASTQARFALERHAWNEAGAITPRSPSSIDWDRFMWAEATAVFARGLGSAHVGNDDQVQAATARLTELEHRARAANEELFARNIQVLRLELTAWSEHMHDRRARSIQLMHEATELEMSTPKHAVTPGPTLPALELLGDLQMAQEQPAQALVAYRRSLTAYPRRFNSLLGAARAARAAGDTAAAVEYYETLLRLAAPDGRKKSIAEAQRFLAEQR